MTATKDILNAGLAAQAASLALSNIKRKRKKRHFLGQAMDNIVGTAMIKEQASFIGGL